MQDRTSSGAAPANPMAVSAYMEKLVSLRPVAAALQEACNSGDLAAALESDHKFYEAYRELGLPSKQDLPIGPEAQMATADEGRTAARSIFNDHVSDSASMERIGRVAASFVAWVDSVSQKS